MGQLRVAQNIHEALQIQIRVVWALMLRETKTMYGRSKLGYLWVVIQTLFGVCVFWGIRVAMGSNASYGLPLPVFLLCGFTAWNVFSECIQKLSVSIEANQGLLYYSKVRHFDIMLSRVLLIGATNVFVFMVLSGVFYLLGYNMVISNLWPFIISWFFLVLLGAGLGAACCALKRYFDSSIILVNMVLRIAFFLSGVLFSASMLPAKFVFIVDYNPMFQLIEFSRTSFSYVYRCDVLNFKMIALSSLTVCFFGLTAELLTRGKVDVV